MNVIVVGFCSSLQSHSLALPLWHLDMRSGHEMEQEWFNNLDNWLLCERGLIVPVIVRLLSSRIETRRFQMRHNIDICSCQTRQSELLKNAIPIAASAFRLSGLQCTAAVPAVLTMHCSGVVGWWE